MLSFIVTILVVNWFIRRLFAFHGGFGFFGPRFHRRGFGFGHDPFYGPCGFGPGHGPHPYGPRRW